MKAVTCDDCHQKVNVEMQKLEYKYRGRDDRDSMYYYDERVICMDSPMYDSKCYEAAVYGKAICPYCGATITKRFKKEIYPEDIIKLAGGID